MCKFIRKSPVAIIAATSTLMLLAPTMYAKQGPSSNLDSKAIVAQLKAGQQNQISQNYQPIPSLATTLSAIQNSSSLRTLASTQTTQNTQNSIDNELQSIRKAIIPQEKPISDIITLKELTAGLPASDSINLGPNIDGANTASNALIQNVMFAQGTPAMSLMTPIARSQLKQNDMLFNFNAFFAPNTTINNVDQLQYSSTYKPNIFIHTLTNPAGFNSSLIAGQLLTSLDKFKTDLKTAASDTQHPDTVKQAYAALYGLQTDPVYEHYQLMMRQLIATRSMISSYFNHIAQERIAPETGLPSALQAEKTMANAEVGNPAWQQSLQTASPATIQRQSLLMLAEIKSMLFQQHLDSERQTAMLAVSALSSLTSETQTLALAQDAVNKVVTKYDKPLQSGSGSSSNSSSSNNTTDGQDSNGNSGHLPKGAGDDNS